MLLDYIIVIAGFVLVILIMVFIVNPPEAWVKKAFLGKQKKGNVSNAEDQNKKPRV